jgi:N-acetylglucosaminyldiphosphoundecaprenol N-acetyl-beta-D-mannosaminyltransferase
MARADSLPTVSLAGLDIAQCDLEALLEVVFGSIADGEGGWLMTANVDLAHQGASDPEIRGLQESATIVVADGTPLVWASRLRGTPLPGRIAGSDLVFHLSERCAREQRTIFLLGGDPGAAEATATELTRRWPELSPPEIADPWVDARPTAEQVAATAAQLATASPDIVLVALGSPKTERLIAGLRKSLPQVWWVGVGIGLGFAAGQVRRAPRWMQRIGAEWLHRLLQEPRRLARRYLVDDLPFALRLLASALVDRVRGKAER